MEIIFFFFRTYDVSSCVLCIFRNLSMRNNQLKLGPVYVSLSLSQYSIDFCSKYTPNPLDIVTWEALCRFSAVDGWSSVQWVKSCGWDCLGDNYCVGVRLVFSGIPTCVRHRHTCVVVLRTRFTRATFAAFALVVLEKKILRFPYYPCQFVS